MNQIKVISLKWILIFAQLCVYTVSYADLSTGLIAHYTFEGNPNDVSGNGNNGTAYSGVSYVAGKAGLAAKFDGIDDYIEIPHPGYLDSGSIAGWVNFTSLPSPPNTDGLFWLTITKENINGNCDGMNFGLHPQTNNNMSFGIFDFDSNSTCTGNWNWSNSNLAAKVDVWQHFVGTWGADGIKTYINGQLVSTNAYTGGIPVQTLKAFIGASSWGNYVNALVDDVRIYNRVLTDADLDLFYDDFLFEGDSLDPNKWSLSEDIQRRRWCGDDSGAPTATGTWLDYNTQLCRGFIETNQYGAITNANGETTFSSAPSSTFPYIWSGPPSNVSPFPIAGDFTLEVKMRFDALEIYGAGFYARHWQNSDPIGDNPPKSLENTALRIWGDNSGVRARVFGETVNILNPRDNHVYRLESRDNNYSLYVDDVLVLGPLDNSIRPNAIWIGNPVIARSGNLNWSSFAVDHIRVTGGSSSLVDLSQIIVPDIKQKQGISRSGFHLTLAKVVRSELDDQTQDLCYLGALDAIQAEEKRIYTKEGISKIVKALVSTSIGQISTGSATGDFLLQASKKLLLSEKNVDECILQLTTEEFIGYVLGSTAKKFLSGSTGGEYSKKAVRKLLKKDESIIHWKIKGKYDRATNEGSPLQRGGYVPLTYADVNVFYNAHTHYVTATVDADCGSEGIYLIIQYEVEKISRNIAGVIAGTEYIKDPINGIVYLQ